MKNKKKKILLTLPILIVVILTTLVLTKTVDPTKLLGLVNPMNLKSSDVPYTNNSQSTVQGAIDDLYTKASKWVNPNDMGTATNYIFDGTNKPTTSSPTSPPSGKNVYLGLYADNQYGVCIKRNGTQHCFRHNNWVAEAKHVQEVFSDISCNVYSFYVRCRASDFMCDVYSDGTVLCRDRGAGSGCEADPDGSVGCS